MAVYTPNLDSLDSLDHAAYRTTLFDKPNQLLTLRDPSAKNRMTAGARLFTYAGSFQGHCRYHKPSSCSFDDGATKATEGGARFTVCDC
jgi:hypothetical protein